MSKLKSIGTIVCMAGIVILTIGGATNVEIGALLPLGIGIGAAASGLVAIFKKE